MAYITHRISYIASISIDIILGQIVVVLRMLHISCLVASLSIKEEAEGLSYCICVVCVHVTVQVENKGRVAHL